MPLFIIHHQIRHCPLVFGSFNLGVEAFVQKLDGLKLFEKPKPIHNCDCSVESGNLVQPSVLRAAFVLSEWIARTKR
jgi:hypothetical protein